MEVGVVLIILVIIVVQGTATIFLWLESNNRSSEIQNRLYQAEILAKSLDETLERLTKSVDKAENLMLSLSKREEALKTQEHLLQMREGGWRGV